MNGRKIKEMNIKLKKYRDIEKLKNNLENEFLINLEECDSKTRIRIIDFFSGLVFQKGTLKKISKNEYEVIIEV